MLQVPSCSLADSEAPNLDGPQHFEVAIEIRASREHFRATSPQRGGQQTRNDDACRLQSVAQPTFQDGYRPVALSGPSSAQAGPDGRLRRFGRSWAKVHRSRAEFGRKTADVGQNNGRNPTQSSVDIGHASVDLASNWPTWAEFV